MARPGSSKQFSQGGVKLAEYQIVADEATSAQASGADTGRASAVRTLTFVSPGVTGQELRAVPDGTAGTYLRIDGSLTSSTGPWTNLNTTSLACPAAAGATVTVYVRYVVLRWTTGECPTAVVELRVRAQGPADWTG